MALKWGSAAAFASLLALALVLVARSAPVPAPAYFAHAPIFEIIARDGGKSVRPEGTQLALEAADAMGADALESELRTTRDGVLVLSHSDDIGALTDGAGRLEDLTLAQIQSHDAGAKFVSKDKTPFAHLGLSLLSLDQAFDAQPHARWVLELRTRRTDAPGALCAVILKHRAEGRVLVGAVQQQPMLTFRALCPGVATSMTPNETTTFVKFARYHITWLNRWPGYAMQTPERHGADRVIDPALIAAAHARGLRVRAWSVDNAGDMARLKAIGADGVVVDDIEQARAIADRQS